MQKYRKLLHLNALVLNNLQERKYLGYLVFKIPAKIPANFAATSHQLTRINSNYIFTSYDICNLNRNCNAKISETIANSVKLCFCNITHSTLSSSTATCCPNYCKEIYVRFTVNLAELD
jgi:hypothetical protein